MSVRKLGEEDKRMSDGVHVTAGDAQKIVSERMTPPELRPNDWQKDCKDVMWSMFLLNPNPASDDIEADKQTMRENIARLIRLSTQKGGGHGADREANHIDMRDLPLIEVSILIAATRLALAGYFGEMPKRVTKSPYHDSEEGGHAHVGSD